MKVLLEFELSKAEPNITDLISDRIYKMDCIDKRAAFTATVVDLVEVPVREMKGEK